MCVCNIDYGCICSEISIPGPVAVCSVPALCLCVSAFFVTVALDKLFALRLQLKEVSPETMIH